MNIQVLDIQPRKQGHLFDVQVLVEKEPDVFKVKVQEDKMDKPSIQVASADRHSRQRMQHDARLMSQIDRLVLKVYNGQEVTLPLTITEHLPRGALQAGDKILSCFNYSLSSQKGLRSDFR